MDAVDAERGRIITALEALLMDISNGNQNAYVVDRIAAFVKDLRALPPAAPEETRNSYRIVNHILRTRRG